MTEDYLNEGTFLSGENTSKGRSKEYMGKKSMAAAHKFSSKPLLFDKCSSAPTVKRFTTNKLEKSTLNSSSASTPLKMLSARTVV